MYSSQKGEKEYFSFDNLKSFPLINAIFTRKGGVSPNPWYSLNQGGTTGDNRVNVIENRERAFKTFGLDVSSIYDVWQVHGTQAIIAERPRNLDTPHEKADILITNKPAISLFMRFADCVPIFLFDPVHNVIGIVHAGWKGTANKVTEKAVSIFVDYFDSCVQDIHAGIGPSICQKHYQVNNDVFLIFQKEFSENLPAIVNYRDDKKYLDLAMANKLVLMKLGVTKIEESGLCTACDLTRWYSHRAENGKTGRFGALFSIKSK